jgi:hypothetical protein
VIISDSIANQTYQFDFNVSNQAPILNGTLTTPFLTNFGQNVNYVLPNSYDPEGLPYNTSLVSAPSFVTLLPNNTLNIYPKNCTTDLGDKIVVIKLEDEEPKNFTYNITI